mgnify:FL=1|tara:strand:+ start:170 stop:1045 length:876 start_codon:yes stop_codon:yes gene_type:complete
MSFSSFKKDKLIYENWRGFVNEQPQPEEAAPAAEQGGGSWPADPPKTIKITASSGLDSNTILGAWKKLSSMSPPNDPKKTLAAIGGPEALVKNVKMLEKNFAGAGKNPARIDMPVVDPKKDMTDLKNRLSKGALDVKPPFAPDGHDKPSNKDFPRGLDGADQQAQDAFLTKGLKDKDRADDAQVSLGETPIPVKNSYPTQSAVYLDKSLWNILNFGPTKVGGEAFGKPNLIAIQDEDQNYILDGHHRWSSAFISGGPNASIRVQALKGLNIPVAIAALRSYGNARDNKQKG